MISIQLYHSTPQSSMIIQQGPKFHHVTETLRKYRLNNFNNFSHMIQIGAYELVILSLHYFRPKQFLIYNNYLSQYEKID